MVRLIAFTLLAASLLVAQPARANVLWRGDFETGDLSQWSKAQLVSADRMQVVPSPVAQGGKALRVLVKQGDNPIGASGNRNELVYFSDEPPGAERWYRWQTMWDPTYPSVATWQLFTQWHHSGSDGSPPLEFYVYAEEVRLRVNASDIVWTAPLQRGVWHDFVLHAKWSSDASVGFVELWYDGALVLPRRHVQNQFPGQTNYLKQGLYRSDTVTADGIVFHDGFTIGETEADVRSQTPADADAGQPEPLEPDAGAPAQPEPDAASVAPAADATAAEPPDAAQPEAADAGQPATSDPVVAADAGQPAAPDAGPAPMEAPQPGAVGCNSVAGDMMVPLAMIVVGVLLLVRRRKD